MYSDGARSVDQRRPDAARADVDGEGEVTGQEGSLPKAARHRFSDPALYWISMATTMMRPM